MNMDIINLKNPAKLEALGLAKVWEAYANYCSREDIIEVGFNDYSGYVYIALDCGICLGSAFGQDIEYIVTNFENGEEFFFETFDEAQKKLDLINLELEEDGY